MEEVKIKTTIVPMKFDNDAEKSTPDEFNNEDSIKALKKEFNKGDRSGAQTVNLVGDSKK